MATALVIGFDRFPGAPRNPSSDLVRAIVRRRRPALADVKLVPAVLPTTYAALSTEFPALLKRHNPDVLLLFGLASRADLVRVESRAVNTASAVHPDAARAKLLGPQVVRGGPSELRVRAPLERLAAAIRGSGVSLRHSRDAGRYICNAALFTALDTARRSGRPRQIAFVHIPWPRAPGRSRRPPMRDLVRAGEAALVVLTSASKRG
jgi:pyroglutamyl-peptidase